MPIEPPNLASYRAFCDTIDGRWQRFLEKRSEWLLQEERHGHAAEKVAENILTDFFTVPLNWRISDLNNQIEYADLVLTTMGIKRLVVEVKRPNSLAWDQPSLERALIQVRRYADGQLVPTIAVSDGTLFYAADIVNGGLRDRARLRLDRNSLSLDAFWVSVDGIYREPVLLQPQVLVLAAGPTVAADVAQLQGDEALHRLLHPKYKIPAECFAYVGDAADPNTWKLPFRLPTGSVDEKHLTGAIRSIITNYRGARVNLPEKAVPDVLVRLGKAVAELGKMPGQIPNPPETYRKLYDVLQQMKRLAEVMVPGL